MRLGRDRVLALGLLALCGGFWAASYDIRDLGFQTLGSAVWPRIILAALTTMCLIYLATGGRGAPVAAADSEAAGRAGAAAGWARRYRNPAICFGLFFLFLASLPYLGMLIGGTLFVFLALTCLGGHSPRALAAHAAIAAATIGGMWAIFTFALRVFLPPGVILPSF